MTSYGQRFDVMRMGSNMRFYVPPTLKSDYENLLDTDIEHFTHTFELVRDWFNREDSEDDKVYLRAAYFPINWKSKVGNSDVNKNFRTDYRVEIHKGDIVVDEDGTPHLLNWDIQNYPNTQTTQAVECNLYLTVTRNVPRRADRTGRIIDEAHKETIFEKAPASFWEYASRPEYQTNYNAPGVLADATIVGQVQFNETTRQVRLNDEFEWGNITYRIINIDWTEVDINETFGLIKLTAKRVGGEVYDADA